MIVYSTCDIYIQSKTVLSEKIAALDLVIQALEDSLTKAVLNESLTEYKLNDGQTIISQTYRGIAGIQKALEALEAQKQRYVNRLNGRVTRAVDGKNFRNPYGTR